MSDDASPDFGRPEAPRSDASRAEPARRGPRAFVETVEELDDDDLAALCEATDAAILDGGGFGWINPPGRRALESYYRGVLLVPERELLAVRLDGLLVGSAHLVKPPRNNEAQSFAAHLMHSFVAPYARGHGLARMLTQGVESRARELGYHVLNLDVRETQAAAIRLYESLGYERWGTHPDYALVRGRVIRGFYYCKRLRQRRSQMSETQTAETQTAETQAADDQAPKGPVPDGPMADGHAPDGHAPDIRMFDAGASGTGTFGTGTSGTGASDP